VKQWEFFTPAERRLAVLLFAQAALGQMAQMGGQVSPEVARWLEGDVSPSALPETTTVRNDSAAVSPPARNDTLTSPPPALESVTLVDLNTADLAALMRLPGVGPVLAERILESRKEAGPYAKPEDLLRVKGIGPAKLAKLRPHLAFGHQPSG
jgi:competence protein ComEA